MKRPSSFQIKCSTDGRINVGVVGDVDGGLYPFKALIDEISPKIKEVLYKQHSVALQKKADGRAKKAADRIAARKKK